MDKNPKIANTDPVHFNEVDGQWWFWDETWAEREGPYATAAAAHDALVDYRNRAFTEYLP